MDYYQLIKENAIERRELTDRQDEDVKLRDLVAYVMKSFDGKTPVEGVFNQTLNRPKVMATFIIAALSNTSEQILIETEEKNFDTDYVKDFRRLAFAVANARLLRLNEGELNAYIDEQSCIRGGAASKCLFQMVKDKLVPEITPWDYRYVNYEMGVDDIGVEWASYGYGTKRRKASIKSEKWYKTLKEGATISGKEAEVVEVWDTEHNEILLDGKKVFEQEHAFGFTPVVILGVPIGSMLANKEDIKNHNESIFFLIREAMPELNRLVTIIQTLAFNALYPPAGMATKEGSTNENIPQYDQVMKAKSLTAEDIGGGTHIINQGDANRAAMMAMERMDRNMNEGGFIPRQLDSPAPSGVALIVEKEGRDVIYLPRLKLKGSMKTALGDMFTAQVLQIGGTVEIGTPGHKRKFETGKLEGQYEVSHKFSVKSLATDAGLASLAAAYGNLIPDRAKRRDILQREDPDGDERWLSWEEAGRLSPLVKLRRIAKDLGKLGEGEEAKLITDEAGVKLEQLLSGEVTSSEPEPENKASQVVSLFGGGVGRGGRPKTPEVPEIEGAG